MKNSSRPDTKSLADHAAHALVVHTSSVSNKFMFRSIRVPCAFICEEKDSLDMASSYIMYSCAAVSTDGPRSTISDREFKRRVNM